MPSHGKSLKALFVMNYLLHLVMQELLNWQLTYLFRIMTLRQ